MKKFLSLLTLLLGLALFLTLGMNQTQFAAAQTERITAVSHDTEKQEILQGSFQNGFMQNIGKPNEYGPFETYDQNYNEDSLCSPLTPTRTKKTGNVGTDTLTQTDWLAFYNNKSMTWDIPVDLIESSQGGFLAVGQTIVPGSRAPDALWVLKLTNTGTIEWERTYLDGNGRVGAQEVVDVGNGYVILASEGSISGEILLKIGYDGSITWMKSYTNDAGRPRWYSIDKSSNGIVVGGQYNNQPSLSEIDNNGIVLRSRTFDHSYQEGTREIRSSGDVKDVVVLDNGQVFITGKIRFNGGDWFAYRQEVWYALLDEEWNVLWERSAGLPNLSSTEFDYIYGPSLHDSGEKAIATSDGGFLIVAQHYDGWSDDGSFWVIGSHASLVKVSSDGSIAWHNVYFGDESKSRFPSTLTDVVETDDGYIGIGINDNGRWMIKITDDGDITQEQIYEPTSLSDLVTIATSSGNYASLIGLSRPTESNQNNQDLALFSSSDGMFPSCVELNSEASPSEVHTGTLNPPAPTSARGELTITVEDVDRSNFDDEPADVSYGFICGEVSTNIYSISGRVIDKNGTGIEGVTVSTSGASALTNSNGDYTITGLANGDYTLTPSKEGYTFSPAFRSVRIQYADVTVSRFLGTRLETDTYSIFGDVRDNDGIFLSNITIKLQGVDGERTTITDSNGNYTISGLANGEYTVTPFKEGYTFEPTSRSVSVQDANLTRQSFVGTLMGVTGVQLLANPSFESGSNPSPWRWIGNCNYFAYSNSDIAQEGSRYLATNRNNNANCTSFYQDIDRRPVAGEQYTFGIWARSSDGTPRDSEVVIWARGGGQEEKGNTFFTVDGTEWQYFNTSLTVEQNDHTSLRAEIYLHSLDGIDYFFDNAELRGKARYSISGHVTTSSGTPIVGVTVSAGNGHTAMTNSNGFYTLSDFASGSYTLTPSKQGYTFSPTSHAVTVQDADVTGQDFVGTRLQSDTYSISGHVTDNNGTSLSNITIKLQGTDGERTTTTDPNGNYTLNDLAAGRYLFAPIDNQYTFKPSSYLVDLPPSATGQDFVGTMIAEPELSISHVEVIQVVQNDVNGVYLIANKPTLVRMYVDCGEGCSSVSDVTGILKVKNATNSRVLSASPQTITAEHPSRWQNQRDELDKTLNFLVPVELLTGDVTFTAELNNATHTITRNFMPAKTLKIAYAPIRYKGEEPNYERIARDFKWAEQVFPLSTIEYIPSPTLEWDSCLYNCATSWINYQRLLTKLTESYRLAGNSDYLYGWLPGSTFDRQAYGAAKRKNKVAFGADIEKNGQRTFAHEIAHLMGRRHSNTLSSISDLYCYYNYFQIDSLTDWPYETSHIEEYGFDLVSYQTRGETPFKNPESTYDYMSYCGFITNNSVWTSRWTYERLYDQALNPQRAMSAVQREAISQTYFIASGLVYTDNTASIDPIWVIDSTLESTPTSSEGAYCLQALSVSDSVLATHCFDLSFKDEESGENTSVDGFSLMLPYPVGVNRFVLKKENDELAVKIVSSNSPQATITYPNGGETWIATETYTVTWSASDADNDELFFSVLYSVDGTNWVPLQTGITDTQLAVDPAILSGGEQARIRVIATDGANSSIDESDAFFTVERKGPQVYTLTPEENQIISPNTPIFLDGYAYDLEDGTIDDSILQWASNKDGNLGTGAQILVMLSPGQHLITLSAADSDGSTSTDMINVFVGHNLYLPTVLR